MHTHTLLPLPTPSACGRPAQPYPSSAGEGHHGKLCVLVACVWGKWCLRGTSGVWVGQVECHLFIAALTSPIASEYLPEKWYTGPLMQVSHFNGLYTEERRGDEWRGREGRGGERRGGEKRGGEKRGGEGRGGAGKGGEGKGGEGRGREGRGGKGRGVERRGEEGTGGKEQKGEGGKGEGGSVSSMRKRGRPYATLLSHIPSPLLHTSPTSTPSTAIAGQTEHSHLR